MQVSLTNISVLKETRVSEMIDVTKVLSGMSLFVGYFLDMHVQLLLTWMGKDRIKQLISFKKTNMFLQSP